MRATLLMAVLAVAACAAAQPAIYRLNQVQSLGIGTSGTKINNSGQTTGSYFDGSDWRGFMCQNGLMTDIGSLGGPNTFAYGMNDRGSIVGQSNKDGELNAFRWVDGSMVGILPHLDNTVGLGINNNGVIVGRSAQYFGEWGRPFVLQNGIHTEIGTLGTPGGAAYDVNEAGLVVGSIGVTPQTRQAFYYRNGQVTTLGTFGGPNSTAYAVNGHGVIVGSATLSNFSNQAFVYENGSMTNLGTLGGRGSHARDINDDGWIVGEADTVLDDSTGFIYADGEMYNLNDLVDDSLGDWYIHNAVSINDDGHILAIANHPGFQFNQTVILTPTVPEPGTLACFGFGILALLRRRLRQP